MTQTQIQFCHQYREFSICVLNFAGPPWRGLKSVNVVCYTVVGGESTVCLHLYYVLLNNLRPSCCA